MRCCIGIFCITAALGCNSFRPQALGPSNPQATTLDGQPLDVLPGMGSCATLAYPEQQRGAEGQVTIELVVDTAGQVEAQSVHAIPPSDLGFIDSATTFIYTCRFSPGYVRGRKVPARVRTRVEYRYRVARPGG